MRKLVGVLLAWACWAAAQAPPPAIPDTVAVEANIAYDRHKETVLDILQPKAPAKGKRPGLLCIHGGGFVGGSKEQFVRNCLPYLEQGFVVVNVEYRLAKAATAPAAVEDVLKAAQWFRQNVKRYNVDAKRIVATGASAGGHLALMVGMTPKSAKLGKPAKVAAVVNFFGVTDIADMLDGPHMHPSPVKWVPEQPKRLELARRVSPMTYVRRDVPPILTIHGDQDPTVPYEHGVNLTKALRDAGADAQLISVPGGKHGFPPQKMAELYPQIWDFLKARKILR
jgi:acetyl esterase/lipase